MDLPRGLPTYQHRVGRTARAGQGGTAISMVDDAARRRRPTPPWAAPLHAACCDQVDDADAADAGLLQALRGEYGDALRQFSVDFRKLSAFRYPNPPFPHPHGTRTHPPLHLTIPEPTLPYTHGTRTHPPLGTAWTTRCAR